MKRSLILTIFAVGLFFFFLTTVYSKGTLVTIDKKHETSSDTTIVIYDMTGCADPWGGGHLPNDSLVNVLRTFFEKEEIKLLTIDIDNRGHYDMCKACSCTTGRRFVVKINSKDLDSISKYGFREQKK